MKQTTINPFKNRHPNLWKVAIAILAALVIFVCLTSCSSSKKFKTKETEKKETIQSINEHLVNVKNVDSSTLVYDDSSFTNHSSIKIEFDNGFDVDSEDGDPAPLAPNRFKDLENDYAGAAPKKEKAVAGKTTKIDFTYNINGNIVTSPVPIKNISLVNEQTGQVTALEIKKNISHDSSAATTNAVTQTKTERTTTTKNKKTTSWAWLWITIICVVAVCIIYQLPVVKRFIRPLFALLRSKKKEEPPQQDSA